MTAEDAPTTKMTTTVAAREEEEGAAELCLQTRKDELMALEAILQPGQFQLSSSTRPSSSPSASTSALTLSVIPTLPRPSHVCIRSHVYFETRKQPLQQNLEGKVTNPTRIGPAIAAPNGHRLRCDRSRGRGRDGAADMFSNASPLKGEMEDFALPTHRAPQTSSPPLRETAKKRTEITNLEGISFLPPLRLHLKLPNLYPLHEPPQLVHLDADFMPHRQHSRGLSEELAQWQSHAAAVAADMAATASAAHQRARITSWLRDRLRNEWEGLHSEVIYTWFEWLRESWWEEILTNSSSEDKWRPFKSEQMKRDNSCLTFDEYIIESEQEGSHFESPLAQSLRAHDMLSKRREFEGERFGCGICLEEKRGGRCWRVDGCGHVFCQDCLTGYLSSMIREGYHRQASACPDPECVKARVVAENEPLTDSIPRLSSNKSDFLRDNIDPLRGLITDTELKVFVGDALSQRLHELREKAMAATDPSAGYCPRPGCERIVRGDSKDVGTTYEHMRSCVCGYVYCLYCNKAWHGRSPCSLSSSSALLETYKAAEPGSATRLQMEARYGKANLERMMRSFEEEAANRAWLEAQTQCCPCCHVRIEKNLGCNHMICRACGTHLCYRCGTRLNPKEPYRHFNTLGASCYQKLFDGILVADGPDGPAGPDEDEWLDPFAAVDLDELRAWEAREL